MVRKQVFAVAGGCAPGMNRAVMYRSLFGILLVVLFCCGSAAASAEDERDLFISNLQAAMDTYDNGDTGRAVQLIDDASTTYLHTNWSYTLCGQLFSQMGEDERALPLFDRALEADPVYARAWYYKGMSLSNLGRMGEADACFVRAGDLDPRYIVPWTEKWPYNIILKNLVAIWLVLGFGVLGLYIIKRERLLR